MTRASEEAYGRRRSAVDSSAASCVATGEAVRLAVELDLPVAFVYVRRGPAGLFGAPVYQRRLTKEMARARRVLDRALVVAAGAGVRAESAVVRTAGRPVVVAKGLQRLAFAGEAA